MKRLFALALSLMLFPAFASADFILDDFTVDQDQEETITTHTADFTDTLVNPDITGITRTTSTGAVVDGGPDNLQKISVGGASASIFYDFSTASSTSFNPGENYIILRDFATTGDGTLTITFGNANAVVPDQIVSQSFAMARPTSDLVFDITGLTNIGSLNSVLVEFANNGGVSIASTTQIEFAQIPEPGSIALATMGLAGFGVYRRRRNKKASEAAQA